MRKTYFKEFKSKFHVNEEKKTVTCVMDTACDFYNTPVGDKLWRTEDIADAQIFVGKAICSEKDKFDIEKGKKIAQARARKEALEWYGIKWRGIARQLKNLSALSANIYANCMRTAKYEKDFIDKISEK